MGNRSDRPGYQQWDLQELAQASGVSADKIQEIYQRFQQAVGRDGVLDMNEFANVYQHFPGAQG